MVRVAERVWEHWRDLSARFEEPAIVLMLTSDLSQGEALEALGRAATDAVAALEAEETGQPGEDETRTGSWWLSPAPGGTLIRIDEEPTDFEGLLRRIVGGLESAGVEGELDLYEEEQPLAVPEVVDLFECRLRVRGERFHYRGPNWGWGAHPDSLAAGVATATDWCLANGSQVPLELKVGLSPAVRVRGDDDVHAVLRQGLEAAGEVSVVRLTSAETDRFRTVVVQHGKGRITLIEGGATIASVGWEPSVRSMRAALAAAGDWAVYGFVKRGSRRVAAELANSLTEDWVPTPHFDPSTALGEAFEAELAPDAFGLQLLGPGYAGRLPESPDWHQDAIGAGTVILEHRDPEAWFGKLFVPIGGRPNYTLPPFLPIPPVLDRARADFDGILFTDDVAWHA